MRFWLSSPRIFGGLLRPGVSFGREDWRAPRVPATHRELARKVVRQLARDHGDEVPDNATIDALLALEVERQRAVRPSIVGFIFQVILAVPLTIFVR